MRCAKASGALDAFGGIFNAFAPFADKSGERAAEFPIGELLPFQIIDNGDRTLVKSMRGTGACQDPRRRRLRCWLGSVANTCRNYVNACNFPQCG
ncbi:MAG: hypothetical protein LBU32_00910 [Clostridiales bacterium]|nr:hypothetical protein [Clostridiales bacterium]